MWPFGVVIYAPFLAQYPDLIEAAKHVSVQELTSQAAILSFNIGGLHGPARLDEPKADPAAWMSAPLLELMRDELQPIVAADVSGTASFFH